MVEVTQLKGFGNEPWLKKKWMRIWSQIGERVLRLPKREQNILLEDFRVAIESRIMVMERINDAKRRSDS
ncbi:MAG: hypothetical protein ACUVT5_03520 [Candidatus Bathyarchaeales archaeon]